jgi:hypothetical protein
MHDKRGFQHNENWQEVQAYCDKELHHWRGLLELSRPEVETAEIRGRIKALKGVLELGGAPPALPDVVVIETE